MDNFSPEDIEEKKRAILMPWVKGVKNRS